MCYQAAKFKVWAIYFYLQWEYISSGEKALYKNGYINYSFKRICSFCKENNVFQGEESQQLLCVLCMYSALAVDKIMKDLDQCRDGKVGFQSFLSLVAGLTIACNDYFVVNMKQKGKK